MKNALARLCLMFALTSSGLFAQTHSSALPAIDAFTSGAHHVGMQSYYKLGSKEAPVTANEYCAFLNSREDALKYYGDPGKISISYYDFRFMNSVGNSNWNGEHEAAINDDCITRHNTYHYRYTVIPGRGEFIIDGLSWFLSIGDFIFNNFNTWRKNPTVPELCEYINAQAGGLDAEIVTVREQCSDSAQQVWGKVDFLMKKHAHEAGSQGIILDEFNRPILRISKENDQEALHATVVEGMEYYRPNTINWSSVASQN